VPLAGAATGARVGAGAASAAANVGSEGVACRPNPDAATGALAAARDVAPVLGVDATVDGEDRVSNVVAGEATAAEGASDSRSWFTGEATRTTGAAADCTSCVSGAATCVTGATTDCTTCVSGAATWSTGVDACTTGATTA
jgi:hypothetical protein